MKNAHPLSLILSYRLRIFALTAIMAVMQTWTQLRRIMLRALRGLAAVGICVLALLALVCVLVIVQAGRDETHQANAAIVLGAAQWNGEPSPVLRARLDHARDLYARQIVSRIILTGGVGEGDKTSEAAAGRDYLVSRGIAPEVLLLEEQGTTTRESLANAATIARANALDSLLLVSDGYHMLRALKIAHDLELNAAASPLPVSSLSAEDAAHVLRESGAYLAYLFVRQ